jgi:hypothetical protein
MLWRRGQERSTDVRSPINATSTGIDTCDESISSSRQPGRCSETQKWHRGKFLQKLPRIIHHPHAPSSAQKVLAEEQFSSSVQEFRTWQSVPSMTSSTAHFEADICDTLASAELVFPDDLFDEFGRSISSSSFLVRTASIEIHDSAHAKLVDMACAIDKATTAARSAPLSLTAIIFDHDTYRRETPSQARHPADTAISPPRAATAPAAAYGGACPRAPPRPPAPPNPLPTANSQRAGRNAKLQHRAMTSIVKAGPRPRPHLTPASLAAPAAADAADVASREVRRPARAQGPRRSAAPPQPPISRRRIHCRHRRRARGRAGEGGGREGPR